MYHAGIVADANQKNIRPAQVVADTWDSANPAESLEAVRKAVEAEGQSAINWYWKEKQAKSIFSRWIRLLAFLFTAAAGLAPIGTQLYRNIRGAAGSFDSGPVASLCVGIAAALLGLDKAFGYSSGWTRYVLTATSLTKLLHEFRLDWIALTAAAAAPPTVEQQAAMIQRAKDFVSTVQGMIMQETKEWATEFQSNMAQMEKDLKGQLDSLKAQMEKAAKEKEAAAQPGSIELTVTNADKSDGFQFHVVLEGTSGRFGDSVSNAKVWTRIDTVPGQYKVTIDAKAKGNPVSTSTVTAVKPGETAKPSVTLPIA